MMRQIFNEIIKRNNFTPDEWKKVKIRVIHKKGDVENVSNYRPICSLPAMYKLFSTTLYGRLYPMLDQKQAEDQAGFNRNARSGNQNVDSDGGLHIWEALKSCNVDHEYVSLLRKIYRDQKASVQTDEESEIFDIQIGSKQGDPMSSLLFNTVLQYSLKDVIQRWQKKKGMGIYFERPRPRLPHELAICRRCDAVRNLQRKAAEYKWDSGSTQTRRRFSATRAP